MLNRRTLLAGGGAAMGAAALAAVAGGSAFGAQAGGPAFPIHGRPVGDPYVPMPNPAETPVPNPPFPSGLSASERGNLDTFDELDFEVFSHQEWARLGESHGPKVRVHWPDGHFTDGIDKHIEDLAALFVWGPDIKILEHPLRLATNELTAVTGVMRGTFTEPMPDGKGGFTPPTQKSFAINMATVGIWNRRKGYMEEEFLFWDNLTFYQQLGLM